MSVGVDAALEGVLLPVIGNHLAEVVAEHEVGGDLDALASELILLRGGGGQVGAGDGLAVGAFEVVVDFDLEEEEEGELIIWHKWMYKEYIKTCYSTGLVIYKTWCVSM